MLRGWAQCQHSTSILVIQLILLEERLQTNRSKHCLYNHQVCMWKVYFEIINHLQPKVYVTPKKLHCRYQSCTRLRYVPVIAIPIPVVLISIPLFSKSMISIQIPVASDSNSDTCVGYPKAFNFDCDTHSIMWFRFQLRFQFFPNLMIPIPVTLNLFLIPQFPIMCS